MWPATVEAGIAAKYYFNKDVRDLELVESAFIVGPSKALENIILSSNIPRKLESCSCIRE